MKKAILVFGATGELGGRIARLAVDTGRTVYGVSRGSNARERVDLNGVKMLAGDKHDLAFLLDVCAKLPIDTVIDTVPDEPTIRNFYQYFPAVENFLLVSSTGTFVPLQYFPADEFHPWRVENEVNFHGKIANDKVALERFEKDGFPVTIFRPTNIIGEGRVPLDLWGGRDIEFFRALKAGRPVEVPDCRDILLQSGYNWDLARGMVKALEYPEAIRGEIFVLSCAKAIRLEAYLKCAMNFLNSRSEIRWIEPGLFQQAHPEHTGLPFLRQHMCFSVDKARRILGYLPSCTAEDGLKRALAWCIEHGQL